MENRDYMVLEVDKAYGISHRGGRAHNEDYILVKKIKDAYLLAVADGIGGHNAGEVASKMAVDTLEEFMRERYREDLSIEEVANLLEEAYKLAHERIKENAIGEREGMGTTLVSALVKGNRCVVANCGDSRGYLIRKGKVVQRTKDHSFVQSLIDMDLISEEEAMFHPMKNILTAALGLDELLVDTYTWDLKEGDVILLSSDGLHDYVEKEEILKVVNMYESPKEIAEKLLDIALEKTEDNVSIVVYRETS
ncbi:MAG TPA: serine/threonine-protein phosphatase [Methanothermococcus okinawensis]|uniref:Serine/threonine-protein phosphatase n=1 Tax=Methanothermococcus okinawensis TaxID=155863 RepID=A0A833EC48_9EURY|nr:serine/threonine-protein phosphatase [Methanothermococcus okinawensis]